MSAEPATQTSTEGRGVTAFNLFAYGIGDFFGGGSFLIIGMLFMFFLTEHVGLTPWLAGLVFGIGKVWDAVSDPLMGYISDRTRSKFGRRRVYFLVGVVPIAVAFLAMWLDFGLSTQAGKFVYYSAAYILFSTVFTMVMVPYAALNAELSTDYSVRTRLSGARMVFSQFSALLAGTVPNVIIQSAGGGSRGYTVMALVFAVAYSLPWFLVFAGTWELTGERRPEERRTALEVFRRFGSIFRNRSFRVHIGMYIFAYSALDMLMALFVYFLNYYLGRPELYPVAMGSLLVTQLAAMPVYVRISNRRGKGRAYVLGLAIAVVGLMAAWFLEPGTPVPVIAAVCALIGFGQAAGVMIPWAILPSVTDVDELITGKQRAGTYAGAMTLFRKFVQGVIALPLVGLALEVLGFGEGTAAGADIESLKLVFMFGPASLLILGILVASQFRITPHTHRLLRQEIDRLAGGGAKSAVTEETRRTCERMTGINYDELYRA